MNVNSTVSVVVEGGGDGVVAHGERLPLHDRGKVAKVWRRSSATTGTGQVVLDIDASLMEVHSVRMVQR